MDHPVVALKETTEPIRRTPLRYTALLADYWSRLILRGVGTGFVALAIVFMFFGAVPLLAWLVPQTIWILFALSLLAPAAYAGWGMGDSVLEKIFGSVAFMVLVAAGAAWMFSLAV